MANPQNSATMPRSAKAAPAQSNSMADDRAAGGMAAARASDTSFSAARFAALLLMLSVFVMFFAGLGMQGKVYSFNTGDLLDILGFVGDLGAGALYFVARMMDWGVGNIHRAVADYGTKYIVVAGLLNVIAAVDAHHIAIGKKQ